MKHESLPFFDMKVYSLDMVSSLRSLSTVRYLEPLGYEVDFKAEGGARTESSKGCNNDPDFSMLASDYVTVSPGAKASWHFDRHRIRQAWNSSTGKNITIGLIDTGLSPNQANLNGRFNSGLSRGRRVEKRGFFVSSVWWWADPDGPNDKCGHGTAMAGVMSAPRSNDGSSVGVAYNSNLIAVRGTGDVVINSGKEKTGVADALVFLGNRNDVKIISMSIGDVFYNSKVADAVRYAYGKGKLIFAAAGTSTSFTNWYGVIFPASMNETVAVTGIKEGQYKRCNICHSGKKVDFTIEMERSGTNRHALTLAMSGKQPSTVGGSSVATATAAGIAALVWAKNPSMNRNQVLTRMRNTADLYPNRNSKFGWGNLNAAAAVNY
ncbi:MAG: S8 family serine peptidase [Bacteroidota bacterium]